MVVRAVVVRGDDGEGRGHTKMTLFTTVRGGAASMTVRIATKRSMWSRRGFDDVTTRCSSC